MIHDMNKTQPEGGWRRDPTNLEILVEICNDLPLAYAHLVEAEESFVAVCIHPQSSVPDYCIC